MEEIQKHLFELQDMAYRDFHSRLMPDIDKETIIGIRVPLLRKYAKSIAGTELSEKFIKELPHHYYEENNLHMMLITRIKDYDKCLSEVERFLPYIDNWATCDFPAPKCFENHKEELLPVIKRWIASGETYTIRYAKQGDAVIPYIEEHRMSDWVHRKTIQKAVESYRITDEQKRYLKGYR